MFTDVGFNDTINSPRPKKDEKIRPMMASSFKRVRWSRTVSYTHLDVYKRQVTDCYTLFRDAYHLAGIEMPDFHREDDWWRTGQNLYLDNLEATGLYKVPLSAAQPGDVLLCCFGSSVPNHAAIYLSLIHI